MLLLRSGAAPNQRRVTVDADRRARGRGRSVLAERAQDRARTERKIIGGARDDEHEPALAEAGKKGGSANLAGRNLWVVYRGLWHCRLESGKDTASGT